MTVCAAVVAHGGPGWPNLLVNLFFSKGAKFAWIAVLSPFHAEAANRWQRLPLGCVCARGGIGTAMRPRRKLALAASPACPVDLTKSASRS